MKWETSKLEHLLIHKIAIRAVTMATDEYDLLSAEVDITAVHTNDTALDLEKLLKADNANFGHDVFGIRRFIDRKTGKLGGCFSPRCAMCNYLTA